MTAREARHAELRAAGFGDKLDQLIALFGEHRTQLEEVERLTRSIYRRGATGRILRELSEKARAGRLAMERELDDPQISDSPFGSLGDWGPNGHAPRIAKLVREARFHVGERNG